MKFRNTRCQLSPSRPTFFYKFEAFEDYKKQVSYGVFAFSSPIAAVSIVCDPRHPPLITELGFNSIHLISCVLHHFWTTSISFKGNQIARLLMTVEQIERHFCVKKFQLFHHISFFERSGMPLLLPKLPISPCKASH